MWIYHQRSGQLHHGGNLIGTGYAGTGKGRNNPAMQHVKATGPLPRGIYNIGPAYHHPKLGPICMNLEPDVSNEMHGRSLFRIHGNNKVNDASLGCVIQGPAVRKLINASADKILQVVE
jgi:hypothetical protein